MLYAVQNNFHFTICYIISMESNKIVGFMLRFSRFKGQPYNSLNIGIPISYLKIYRCQWDLTVSCIHSFYSLHSPVASNLDFVTIKSQVEAGSSSITVHKMYYYSYSLTSCHTGSYMVI